jgi:hypothetical protein
MTKGRVALTSAAVIGDGQSRRLSAIFIPLGGPRAHGCSGRDDSFVVLSTARSVNRSRGHFPQMNCHPDRSVAQWRDLRFPFGFIRLHLLRLVRWPVIGGNQFSFIADQQESCAAIFKLAGEVLAAAHIVERDRLLVGFGR